MAAQQRPRAASLKARVGQQVARVRARSRLSIHLPDRFQHGDDDDDVDDGTGVGSNDHALNAQQSMYGMLAATQSRPSFPSGFEQESGSDSDDDPEDKDAKASVSAQARSKEPTPTPDDGLRHPKSFPGAKLARSWLKPVTELSSRNSQDQMTQSQILPSPRRATDTPLSSRIDAPVLDRKLKAMARARMGPPLPDTVIRKIQQDGGDTSEIPDQTKIDRSLPEVIANIFSFVEPEEVISEYPCWYLQNVLLQGYMYITQKHVCFYAYLQKKTNVVVKSGYLGKQGRHSYRYRRFWFVLKGDVFSYYRDASDPYSPQGLVDLRDAISAEITSGQADDGADFTITTPSRVYLYRADTLASAKEWIKQLQRIIFRSHNDSDSVKISLPIANIVDVEQSPVIDFAETIRLRVIDNDETYAMDEYFFTFFSFGKDAWDVLNGLTIGGDSGKGLNRDLLSPPDDTIPLGAQYAKPDLPTPGRAHSPSIPISEPVRTTLSPMPPSPKLGTRTPRTADDVPSAALDRPNAKFDRRERSISAASKGSFSGYRASSPDPSSPAEDSTESFVTTSEHPSIATMDDEEIDAHMSASQMLSGDGVFGAPTLRMPHDQRQTSHANVDGSYDLAFNSRDNDNIRIQPPSRTATPQALEGGRPHADRQRSDESHRTALESDPPLKTYDVTLPSLATRGITAPLQHAITVAGMVRNQSKRMSSYLSSSPKNYIDKWSGALAGGKRHYTDIPGLAPDDSVRDPEQEFDVAEHERRFREHFGLPSSEKLVSVFYCWLHRTVPFYGKVYISDQRFCFRSLLYGTRTKLVIPYRDILTVQKQRGFRWGNPGMVLVIRGHEELFFDFQNPGLRDDCVVTVLRSLELIQAVSEPAILSKEELEDAEAAAAENKLLEAARRDGYAEHDLELPRNIDTIDVDAPPILFDDTHASMLDFKPPKPMHIVCLTIGSRGDVQPYIALCKGLIADGHMVKIATHGEFRAWVESYGIEFAEVSGDPAELMRICVDNGMFTPAFFMEANSKFRSWLESLLTTAYEACKGSDLLIESPSAMCGIHIAEALRIPYFRAFTMPWTRTRAYPHAFAVPNRKLGGSYNYMTYTLFDNMFWQATAGQINKWRAKTLGLAPTSLDKLQQNKVPFLYNFSPSVVVPPLDFSDWIKVTGYWFLDEGMTYTPPEELADFIQKARAEKMKLVYIGFGSVTVSDSRQLTQQIVDAVVNADVRCILSKGWSDRFDKQNASEPEVELPPCIHQIRAAPHDWLFKQMDAVVHHGGAGTTGASLRAGKPTLIKPFFGDQFFFATRVEDLGVGMHLKKVTANQLSKALWIATHDDRMRTKAHILGEAIRSEKGVETAIRAIYRDLEYARTLVKKRVLSAPRPGVAGAEDDVDGEADDTEENWTFVENEGEPQLTAYEEIRTTAKSSELTPTTSTSTKSSLREHARHLSISSVVRRSRKDG